MSFRDPILELSTQGTRTAWSGPSWTSGVMASLAIHTGAVAVFALGAWAQWWPLGQWQPLSLSQNINSASSRSSQPLEIAARPVLIESPESNEPITLVPPDEAPPEFAPQSPAQARTLEASVGALPPVPEVKQVDETSLEQRTMSMSREQRPAEAVAHLPTTHAERLALPRRQTQKTIDTATTTNVEVAANASPSSTASAASRGAEAPPQEVFSPAPAYPPELLAARIGGVVKLRVKVADDGHVLSASLYKTSGYPAFDREALKVILQWRFTKQDERRVTAREFVKPLNFRIVP